MLKKSLLILTVLTFGASLWLFSRPETQTLTTLLAPYQQAGEHTKQDLSQIASLPVHEADGVFRMEDDGKQGIQIAYANEAQAASEAKEAVSGLSLSFPKTLDQPLEIKLDEHRIITLTDQNNHDLKPELLSDMAVIPAEVGIQESWFKKLLKTLDPRVKPEDDQPTYLSYQNPRKTILYTLKKDQATNEKQLKSWTLYQSGNGIEQEAYRIDHAQVKINEEGQAELFYQGDQDLKNQQAQTEVEPSLLERAQRTLEKELGEDILNSDQSPDLVIPKPFFYDKDGERHESDWAWDQESKTLSLELTFQDSLYPIALDPTLQFTAPATSNTGEVITGEVSSQFGNSMVTGDFNADGKTDLAIGAPSYSSSTGRVYLFYQDGAMSTTAVGADVVMTGEGAGDQFGYALAAGDLNADGRMDLTVSGHGYSGGGGTGRAYIFYNDGSIPTTAASADVKIDGESGYFGYSLVTGDFNADGKTDLVVGATYYASLAGRAYIFYNDGSIPTTAASADVKIDGEASSYFGYALASGDLNADGKTDLIAGVYFAAKTYIFYNDGSIPTTAATADVIITGTVSTYFGSVFTTGDFNADGRVDLAAGNSSGNGAVYIFYNDGSIPTTVATADVTITGEGSSGFGITLAAGDFNADSKTDLSVGATGYSTIIGRAYVFYNDGSIPTTAATADVIITGETTNNAFGASLGAGDFNTDGKTDLAVGAYGYSSNTGRAYIFYSQNGQVNTNRSIGGEASGDFFGTALASGDFNADGRIDLAVGAYTYSSSTGRAYIFYNDGSIPTTAASADVKIDGEASSYFGYALASGDLNADGKVDLTVGARGYSSNTGRAYIFYNDGSIPTTAATADVIITGAVNTTFGVALATGDFNTDGRVDLIVGAHNGGIGGMAYVFYNDGSIPTTAATADVTITGEGSSNFGTAFAAGDFNADGRADIAIGGYAYVGTYTGRTYIFYNDGSIPTTAATADVIITGEAPSGFGYALASGDFNADGRIDLAVGGYRYSTFTGRTYIFYNDGSIPTTAATADVIITGEATNDNFGNALSSGDFNADGKTDLVVGAYAYPAAGGTGRAYIFYNDSSIPTTAATADIIMTGGTNDFFGAALVSGDFNADGRTDLTVGAWASGNTGKVYFYETRENFAWQLQSVPLTTPFRTQTGSGAGEELSILGESGNFGAVLTSGDFNADGKTDLAVSANNYGPASSGRVYLFYSDGSITSSAASADMVITDTVGYTRFGSALAAGDLNADGRTDLIVSTDLWDSSTAGQVKIFYNDGSYPATSPAADVTITGEASSNFGGSLAVGDFNADGKADLAVGGFRYSSSTGRAYIFYNDGSIPTTAATADVIITGEATSDVFGILLAAGDFNADGKTDLAVGSYVKYYFFYNDGSYASAAASADTIITGSGFTNAFVAGDWNADGKTDLAVADYSGATYSGRVYLFYNDGSYPATYASADVTISGSAPNLEFGSSVAAVDVNADGKADLVVGAGAYYNSTGGVYAFYNDGSYPATNASADLTLTGEGGYFGYHLAVGDFNTDGKADLAVGAHQYATNKGKVYLYTWNDATITGETTSNYFGGAMTSGDWNADGKIDLAVGAYGYSSNTGRVYIFYNDSVYPSGAASADVIITGGAAGDYFGISMTPGDLNADGRTDLIVSARYYSSGTGRVYIFYNDGSIPTTATTADVTITGTAASDSFGSGLTTGDLNTDGRTDLVVGSSGYNSGGGRAYIFYNDGSIPTTAATADVTISGDMGSGYGLANGGLVTGDFNTDGRTDLAVGGASYSSYFGRVNIFYNDGSIPTTAATSDVTIFGTATNEYFGSSLVAGDFNVDGKTDLAVSGWYSSKVFVFYNDGSYPALSSGAEVQITGSNEFGKSLVSGDFNADGKIDLAVGANGYGGNFGFLFVFYNDGSYPSVQASADYISESTSGLFGNSLASGDFNSDGTTDIAVGAYNYSTDTGRAYIITTEAKVDAQAGVRARGITRIRGNFMMKR